MIEIIHEMDTDKIAKTIIDRSMGKDAAILYRNHFLGKKLSELLTNLNFPHTRIGANEDLMDTMEFRVFHAFLKLIQNPHDSFSFLLVRELLGVTRKQYGEIRMKSTLTYKSHFQEWWKSGMADEPTTEFFSKSTPDDSPVLLADRIQETWPFDSPAIMEFIDKWMDEEGEGTLEDYLSWLATYDLQDEIKEQDDKLKLMTIHSAKGLEWPTVMIIGCNDGILPSKQAIEAGDDEIESERRLMYVAVTRARDSLILAVRPELTQGENGKYYENPESRFLGEI
jgi:DNA helicase-2/ATP-dependent DNA helicase PcrA